jgi:SAM-dependent methyltransferase
MYTKVPMISIERVARIFIPSTAKLSYNPLFRLLGDMISALPCVLYPEFRSLPPNHLRVRIGVGNKLLFNQAQYLEVGYSFWLQWLSRGYVTDRSDILEIGCGCGRIAHHLRGEWFTGTYIGVDIDQELLNWDSSNFPPNKFKFVSSSHTSATYSAGVAKEGSQFTFPDNWEKDFIYSTSLYTHLLERELINYTNESFRVLRRGGTMFMTFFCLDSVELGKRWTFQHKIGEAYVESMKYPEAAVAYSRKYIQEMCQSVGFSNVSVIESKGQSSLICTK